MGKNTVTSNANVDSFFEVKFEIYANDNLQGKHDRERGGEGGVDVMLKLSAFMSMTQKVASYRENDASGLERDVPSGADNLDGKMQSASV